MKTYISAFIILAMAFTSLALLDATADSKHSAANNGSCSYKPNKMSTCDQKTNARIIYLKLKPGSAHWCLKFKFDTVPCKDTPTKARLKLRKPSADCKYKSAELSLCNSRTNARVVTLKLERRGSPRSCKKRMLNIEPCAGGQTGIRKLSSHPLHPGEKGVTCRYVRVNTTKCDPATRTRVVHLKVRQGMPAKCPKTKVETRPCRGLRNSLNPERRKNSTCIYISAGRTSCNPLTKKRNVTLNLIQGNHALCDLTKIRNESCIIPPAGRTGRKCRYTTVNHTTCDNGAKTFNVTLKLREGRKRYCQEMIVENRICKGYIRPDNVKQPGQFSGGIGSTCDYIIIHTTQCNNDTHTFAEVLSLMSGNSSICAAAKVMYRPCPEKQHAAEKNAGDKCKYITINRTTCNAGAKMFTVTLKLQQGNRTICLDTVVEKRRCEGNIEPDDVTQKGPFSGGKSVPCEYVSVHRSICEKSHRITEILRLKHGNPGCAPTKIVYKPCRVPGSPYILHPRHHHNVQKGETKSTSGKCQYAVVRQSPCNKFTHHRKLFFKLIKGDKSCKKLKTEIRSCADASHCKYQRIVGKCVNHKRSVSYKVVTGGSACQKVPKKEPCGYTDKRKAENNHKTVEVV